jgi:hypothetical protein
MTIEIKIRVPDELGHQLARLSDRLTEVVERGAREILAEEEGKFQEESQILELLASRPRPEKILAIRPSTQLQTRISRLLALNKQGELSRQDELQLERYLTLEHLVRLAKAHAYQQLTKTK